MSINGPEKVPLYKCTKHVHARTNLQWRSGASQQRAATTFLYMARNKNFVITSKLYTQSCKHASRNHME